MRPDAQHYRRVMAVFEAALATRGAARATFVERECRGDARLRGEVEAMLAQADSSAEFAAVEPLLQTGGGLEAMLRAEPLGPADSVGRASPAESRVLAGQYRILRVIGEGGMGVVYEAEQLMPRRYVALKAIRSAFASREMLRRFEREAHILGRLHHPGIAQIYEAGAASPGRGAEAFFAMELVRGLRACRSWRACATRCSTRTSAASSTAT
jgi:hypothetical protein